MKLHIIQLASLLRPINSNMTYGSIERVVSYVAQGLEILGHDSTVIASEGSKMGGRVISCPLEDYNTQANLLLEYIKYNLVDVIHIHRRDFLISKEFKKLQDFSIPVLVTLHGPVEHIRTKYVGLMDLPNVYFNGVSGTQQNSLKAITAMIGYVYNGVDPALLKLASHKSEYLLSFGRIARVKGVHVAIKLAREIGRKLIIAGVIIREDKKYFNTEIVPHIDGVKVEYIGPLTDQQKSRVLSEAEALLMPIEWDDPCPLVALEAMASGTPVVAYNRGALPELVTNGVTGYVVQSYNALRQATINARALNSSRCRDHAIKCFSWQRTTFGYLDIYKRIRKI